MSNTQTTLTRDVPIQNIRTPQHNIPQTRGEREYIRIMSARYVSEHKLTPPLSPDQLRVHADAFVRVNNIGPLYADYCAVIISNYSWHDTLAGIPYDRRLLLLPKCLRIEERCPAPFDEYGLLCKQCGLCTIQDLQEAAEKLGYAVLVAEGSAIVTAIIESKKIEAIVGVSCLSVLERAFPYMEMAAIPGIAIPLLQDDCANTNVDIEWVWEIIHLTGKDTTHRLDLDALHNDVKTWFNEDSLDRLMGPATSETERISREWMQRDGKRWRPFLSACAYLAMSESNDTAIPDGVKKIALAVECFHKASLVHDDIEDDDDVRYGEATLHMEHGIPVALNIGDLLIGEGYRMIAESEASGDAIREITRIAAEGHRTLSLGQGAELLWSRNKSMLTREHVLEIFEQKTSPAFDVALRMGAAYCDADTETQAALAEYSRALGVAYQINDDLSDFDGSGDTDDLESFRPSILMALAAEKAVGEDKETLEAIWSAESSPSPEAVREIYLKLGIPTHVSQVLENYKTDAMAALGAIPNVTLKSLLRRVMTRIFNAIDIKGWCHEFENRDDAGSPPGSESAA